MDIWARLEQGKAWLRELGYTGERRAVALLPLCLFGLLYFVLALTNAQPGWAPALFGLALCYLVAFFAVAAGWFWARWFATGLAASGVMVAMMAMALFGYHPSLAIYGGLHLLVVVMLLGPKMAARYELRSGWRERYAMDEFGVARLGKAVTRGAGALPSLILWAFAPREPQSLFFPEVAPFDRITLWLGLGFLLAGLVGFVRQRGYAVLAMGAAAVSVAVSVLLAGPDLGGFAALPDLAVGLFMPWAGHWTLASTPTITLLFVTAAFWPWARPLGVFLTRR